MAVRGRLTPQIQWALLISRQGKVRLSKWYSTMSQKSKSKIVKDVTQLVLARRVRWAPLTQSRMCNFIEYKGAHTGPLTQTRKSCIGGMRRSSL